MKRMKKYLYLVLAMLMFASSFNVSSQASAATTTTTTSSNKLTESVLFPAQWLKKHVAKKTDTYTCIKTKMYNIKGIRTQNSFENGAGNCVPTAIYNIMCYYRNIGYNKIYSDSTTLYSEIRKYAVENGYTPSDGMKSDKIANTMYNFLKSLYPEYGSKGFWPWHELLSNNTFSDLQETLNSSPFVLSLGSNDDYYTTSDKGHAVVCCGYSVYMNNRTGKKYYFLGIYDGWRDCRAYLPYDNTGVKYSDDSRIIRVIEPTK